MGERRNRAADAYMVVARHLEPAGFFTKAPPLVGTLVTVSAHSDRVSTEWYIDHATASTVVPALQRDPNLRVSTCLYELRAPQ